MPGNTWKAGQTDSQDKFGVNLSIDYWFHLTLTLGNTNLPPPLIRFGISRIDEANKGAVVSINDGIARFHQEGFAVFRQAIPEILITEVLAWLEDQLQDTLLQLKEVLGVVSNDSIPDAIQQYLIASKQEEADADLRNAISGHFPLSTRLGRPLQDLLKAAPFRKIISGLLPAQGHRVHMPPMARFILPGNRVAGVPAHQDISYNHHLSDFVTCWVPLVKIDKTCGGVRVYENTQHFDEQLNSLERDIWLRPLTVKGLKYHEFEMDPGDLLAFNPYVIHQSMPNDSDRIRFSIDYRVFGSSVQSTKHYLDLDSWEVVAPHLKAS